MAQGKMNINEILNCNSNVQVVVNLVDLKEFALSLIDEAQAAKKEPEEKYLTADETAVRLGVTKPTLWRWRKQGYLTPVHVGRKIRYRESDVINCMEG